MLRPENRFFRFLLVGALNTVFGYTVYCLLLLAGMHYTLALVCSSVVGVLFNYRTTGRLVFGHRGHGLLARFALVYAVCYGLNVLVLKSLAALGLSYYAGQALVTLPMAFVTFSLNARFVFPRHAAG
jgi:putative flippase GtrA